VSAVLSIITSLFAPDSAMLLYLLNLASPFVARAISTLAGAEAGL
jgi:hypothetical protein